MFPTIRKGAIVALSLQDNKSHENFREKIRSIIGIRKDVMVGILTYAVQTSEEEYTIRFFSINWPVAFTGVFNINDIRKPNLSSQSDQMGKYEEVLLAIGAMPVITERALFDLYETLYDQDIRSSPLIELNITDHEAIAAEHLKEKSAWEAQFRYQAIFQDDQTITMEELRALQARLTDQELKDTQRMLYADLPNFVNRQKMQAELLYHQQVVHILQTSLEKSPEPVLPHEPPELQRLYAKYEKDVASIVRSYDTRTLRIVSAPTGGAPALPNFEVLTLKQYSKLTDAQAEDRYKDSLVYALQYQWTLTETGDFHPPVYSTRRKRRVQIPLLDRVWSEDKIIPNVVYNGLGPGNLHVPKFVVCAWDSNTTKKPRSLFATTYSMSAIRGYMNAPPEKKKSYGKFEPEYIGPCVLFFASGVREVFACRQVNCGRVFTNVCSRISHENTEGTVVPGVEKQQKHLNIYTWFEQMTIVNEDASKHVPIEIMPNQNLFTFSTRIQDAEDGNDLDPDDGGEGETARRRRDIDVGYQDS